MTKRKDALRAMIAMGCAAAALAVASCAAVDAPHADGVALASSPHPDAPEALSHFAPLIGRWAVKDWTRDANGDWVEGPGADWEFAYAMDGWAVEDTWVQPPRDAALKPGAQRFYGVNVRAWDPASGDWKMTWIHTRAGDPQTWRATSTPDEIVMTLTPPGADAPQRRITFFDMTGDTFDWRMELAGEDGGWREAYRIHGDRKPPSYGHGLP